MLVALCGCGRKASILKTVAAGGTVTHNGHPVEGATVLFFPADPDSGRMAVGKTDVAGKFTLETVVGGSRSERGALVGDYKVTVAKAKNSGPAVDPRAGQSHRGDIGMPRPDLKTGSAVAPPAGGGPTADDDRADEPADDGPPAASEEGGGIADDDPAADQPAAGSPPVSEKGDAVAEDDPPAVPMPPPRPPAAFGKGPESSLPAKYADIETSGFTATVPAGGETDFTFDLEDD